MCFESYFGFDYLQDCIDAYTQGLSKGTDMTRRRTEHMGLYVATAFCGETREEAVRIAREVALGYFRFIVEIYAPLGKEGSYEYLSAPMKKLVDNLDNLDYLLTESPSVMIGTPDDFVQRLNELEERGVEEVLLRDDGVPHADIKRSFELMGKEVIPWVS